MSATVANFGTTASEQMYFGGAPLAHIELYYEVLRRKRLARSFPQGSACRHRQPFETINAQIDARAVLPHLRAEFAPLLD